MRIEANTMAPNLEELLQKESTQLLLQEKNGVNGIEDVFPHTNSDLAESTEEDSMKESMLSLRGSMRGDTPTLLDDSSNDILMSKGNFQMIYLSLIYHTYVYSFFCLFDVIRTI